MGFSISASERQIGETNRPPLLVMLLSAAGYYCGAMIGFALTFEPVPISIFWPPNAILLGALLLVPTRNWWLILIAAFPAHVATTLQSGVPMGMVLCWFISNSGQALLGALCVRGMLGQRIRFHCFRDVVVFIVFCAFLTPFALSFLDVAFVKLVGWGQGNYWDLWRLRFFSNIVAVLIVVPPLLTWRRGILQKMHSATPSRLGEGVLLACGLLSVIVVALLPIHAASTSIPLVLYAPLPFLLWAALRFNAFCASMSVLLLAVLAMWSTVQGHGPFTGGPPSVNALSVQVFLISISVPLLLLSAAIAERRRSATSARDEEDKFDIAMMATNIGSWHWDIIGKKGTWSPELRRMLSIESDDASLSLATLLRHIHLDDRAGFMRVLRNATAHGASFEREFRIVRANGQVRWILSKGTSLCDESGRPAHMLGVSVDVTDRRLAEAITREKVAPHENEAGFRQMADVIPQIVWAARPDGYVDYANRKWQELTGVQEQPAGDATWLPFIHPDDRQRYLDRWYSIVRTSQAFEIEYRILFPHTRDYRWHLVRALPVKDETGRTTRWYGTATDIDDEKRAEHALEAMRDELEQTIAERTREVRQANDVLKAEIEERKKAKEAEQMSEARFAKVFRLSPDAMYISADVDSTILDVNERWLTLFKYDRDEVIGKTASQLNLYVGDKDAAVIERHRIGGSIRELEVELRDKEEKIRQAVVSGEAITIGEEACFITIIRDVTEERRAQAEMQQQRELLTHLTRVVMLGELSGALAHELNQPLAAILTNAQAARRFMAANPVDLQEIRDILNDIVAEDKRAGEVIRRLRVLFMKGEPSLHPLNFNEVVHEALDLARSDLAARKVKLRLQLSNDLNIVQGDRIQLQQVILNLIVNACEAMSDRADALRQLSFTTGSDRDGNVRITVSDTGTGIPPDMIGRVFDPVFTTKVHGLGFGLSISRSIITAHGGRIEAINRPEGGATFQITLPMYHGDPS